MKTIGDAVEYILNTHGMDPLKGSKIKAVSAEGNEISMNTPYWVFIRMLLNSRAHFVIETDLEVFEIYGNREIKRFNKC